VRLWDARSRCYAAQAAVALTVAFLLGASGEANRRLPSGGGADRGGAAGDAYALDYDLVSWPGGRLSSPCTD